MTMYFSEGAWRCYIRGANFVAQCEFILSLQIPFLYIAAIMTAKFSILRQCPNASLRSRDRLSVPLGCLILQG